MEFINISSWTFSSVEHFLNVNFIASMNLSAVKRFGFNVHLNMLCSITFPCPLIKTRKGPEIFRQDYAKVISMWVDVAQKYAPVDFSLKTIETYKSLTQFYCFFLELFSFSCFWIARCCRKITTSIQKQ